jgi:hypothetical protein
VSNKSGTSSQVISVPKGGGALSGIGETFSPDLHTGTGNFSVPIALPPGRNGFQPERDGLQPHPDHRSGPHSGYPGPGQPGILNQGQAHSLVVKLEGAVVALNNDRPSAPHKLGAYLNEYEAIVPDAIVSPCFLVATDVRDALILNGWVPEPD